MSDDLRHTSSRSTSPHPTIRRKSSNASTIFTTTSSPSALSEPELPHADWSLARYVNLNKLTFTPEQERIYYEERLGPAALISLSNVYSLGIVIMLLEVTLTTLREENMLSVFASATALVCIVAGFASVKWKRGEMFLRCFSSPCPPRVKPVNDHDTSPSNGEVLQPPLPIFKTHSRKQSIASNNNIPTFPLEPSVINPAASKPQKFSGQGLRYLILTPLAFAFLAILVRADLHSLEEVLSVTGSSYPYIILLSAAAMGLIFTHPLVWYPMGLAALAVIIRCVLIAWSIFSICTNGSMPLLGSNSASAVSTSPSPITPQQSSLLATTVPITTAESTSKARTVPFFRSEILNAIPGLRKREASVVPVHERNAGQALRSVRKTNSRQLSKRNGMALLDTSITGRKVDIPTPDRSATYPTLSTPWAALAALGSVIMYLSSSILAVVVALRFAKSSERGHRLRFIQTKIVQQDRDRLTRERDRSARLLAIVFPKPVISNLLSLWAKNNRETDRSDAVLALDGNVEAKPFANGNFGNGGMPSNDSGNNLEFADRINDVVVAFVDFYTPDVFAGIGGQDGVHDKCMNSRAHARRAVALLNLTFEKFDAIMEKYPGVEKIKTIGTKVMIAGGLFDSKDSSDSTSGTKQRNGTMNTTKTGISDRPPLSSKASAAELTLLLLRLAMETLNTMNFYDPGELDECFEYEDANNDDVPCTCSGKFNLNSTTPRCVRFGIASGTVVAGIVGLERFCLDLWGDSVNTASRMLSVAAKNEVVVTEGIRDGFQYLQTGKMARVLGMVDVKDDFRFKSLGTRDIKGKGPMELFYVTNPAYVNYPLSVLNNPEPSMPSLSAASSLRRKATNASSRSGAKAPRRQATNYRDATAELVAAALGLAKDAEESNAEEAGNNMEGSNRKSLLRRSVADTSAEDNHRHSGTPSVDTSHKPVESNRYAKSSSPIEMRDLPKSQRRLGSKKGKQLVITTNQGAGLVVDDSKRTTSTQPFDSEPPESTPPAYDSSEEVLHADHGQPGTVKWDSSYDNVQDGGGNGRPQSQGQRFSMVIAELSPAYNSKGAEGWNGTPRNGNDGNYDVVGVYTNIRDPPDFMLSNVISDILNDFLSMPKSELSYDRQFSKLSSHLHKWLLRFKDPRVERWYRSVVLKRQTFERKSLELLWDGCMASVIAFAVASTEIFVGGPPSLTVDNRFRLFIPASSPAPGYWIAAFGLVVHIFVALWVSWDAYNRQQCNLKKKKQNRMVVMNAGDDSRTAYMMGGFPSPDPLGTSVAPSPAFPSPADPWRPKKLFSRQNGDLDKTLLIPTVDMPNSGAGTNSYLLLRPRLLSILRISVYHISTLSFFLTITSLLLDTPIGDRTWFAPTLLVTCAFYAIYLDIGAPSFIRASLWTAFLLMVSCITLYLQHRITEIEVLVISSFGFLTFLLLARATQRARRTGFLLRVVVDKQKSLSAGEARRSAQLLMSILPERILRRVIDDPRAMVVEEFAAVTFLHLDIVDFTALSAALAPDDVVSLLNVLFTKFDAVCRQYGVEKMTTIGDAYVAFGLSASAMEAAEAGFSSDIDEEYVPIALATCKAALELQRVVDEFNRSEYAENLLQPSGKSGVRVRVAVHTGRGHGCVLGGTTRLKYEFVGEAIRVAERVQEKTPKGKACVSEATVGKMGKEAADILQSGRGVVDGIYMEVEEEQVDGMRYYVMRKLDR